MAGNNLKLKQAPFQNTFNGPFYYSSPAREESLAAMEQGIRRERGVAVLVGDAGSGKTVLACKLLCRFEGDDRRVFVTCAPNAPGDLIRQVCVKFNVEGDPSQSLADQLDQLRRRIEADDPENRLHVVVLDAADQLGREGFKQLDMLTRIRGGKGHALQIAVFGRPNLLRLLQLRECPNICKRVAFAERIAPFTPEEMSAYIRHRVAAVGGNADRIFTESAVALLCQLSGGLPGVANVIGSAAIELAGTCGATRVTSEIFRQSQSAREATAQVDVDFASGAGVIGHRPAEAPNDAGSTAPGARTAPDARGPETEEQPEALARQAQEVADSAGGTACAPDRQVDALTARAEEVVRRLHDAIEEAEARLEAEKVESLLARVAQMTTEAGKRAAAIEDRLGELMGSTEAAIEAFKAASEEIRTGGVSAMEQRFGELTVNAGQAVQQLRSVAHEVETRALTALEKRQGKLAERAEAAAENLSAMLQEIQAHCAAVESGAADAQAARSDAAESSHRLAALSAQVESTSEAAQERVNLLAAGLEASEGAHQKLMGLSADVGDEISKLLDSSADSLARLQSAIQESVKAQEATVQLRDDCVARMEGQSRAILGQSEAAAATLKSEVELAQRQADEIQPQLLARIREAIESEIMPAVRGEMESLRSATTRAIREMIDKHVEESAARAEESRSQAEASIEQAVRNHMQAFDDRAAAIDDRLSRADRISADLIMNMQTVDAKANELASRVTSAGDAVQALSNATAESRKTIQKTYEQTRAAAQLREELAREGETISNEVRSACDTTHGIVGDLLEKVQAEMRQAEQSLQAARQEKASLHEVTERAMQASSEAERSVGALNQALGDVKSQSDAARDRMNEAARQIERCANDASAQTEERAGELNLQFDRLMADLTQRIDSRMESLDERVDAVHTARSQLITTAEAAQRHAEILQSQVDNARDLMASQARQADEHREIIEELTSQIRKGQSLTAHFEGVKEDALQAHVELAQRSEVAVSLFERASGLVRQLDDRESEIDMQGQILASLTDEREALELRVRQVQTSIETLRLELTSLLNQPQKLVCDAKSQAIQLHDVCRAVKKVFAGLSQASLNASQRIDQLKRLESVAGALQGWVAETANAQQRLTTALTPVLAGPSPVIATVENDAQGDRTSVITSPKRVTARPGQRGGAEKPTASVAAQKARAQQIDRLIREARAQAASVPAGT